MQKSNSVFGLYFLNVSIFLGSLPQHLSEAILIKSHSKLFPKINLTTTQII